jgi:hypothetical protein
MGDTFEGDSSGYMNFADSGDSYAGSYEPIGGGDSLSPDYGFDTTNWPTSLDLGGNTGQTIPVDQSSGLIDLGDGFGFDPNTGNVYDFGSQGANIGGYDPYLDYLNDFIAQGYDSFTAANLAQEATQGHFEQVINEQGAPTQLPQLPDLWPSVIPNIPFDPSINFPSPTFPNVPAPAPPLPQSPATQQPNLPPACPSGQYHPYPIGDPRQNTCVPFPAQSQQQAPRPTGSSGGSSGGSSSNAKPPTMPAKPPTQQACQTGYYRASNGQCLQIPRCTSQGTVFDIRSGLCVPFAQAQQPACPAGFWLNPATRLCEPIPTCPQGTAFDVNMGVCMPAGQANQQDIFGGLKNLPWWLWAGLAAVLLLSKDDDGRTTTVRYRRAR